MTVSALKDSQSAVATVESAANTIVIIGYVVRGEGESGTTDRPC